MDDLQHDSDLIGLDMGPEADPELLELHRELEGLEISERPSFGPELLAELEGTWRSEAVLPMRRRRWPRVAAAMAAGLVIAFASVPSARAAFFRFVAAAAPQPADVTELPPAPEDRFLAVPELQPVADGGLSGPPLDTRTPAVPDLVLPDEGVRFVPAPVSYAELRDRRASQATVRSFYPAGLQEAGVAGVVLTGAYLTDHVFWYRNENLLQATPLSLILAVLVVGAAWRPSWRARAAGLATLIAALSVLGLLLDPLPFLAQRNPEILALAVPVHCAVAWMLRRDRDAARATTG